MTTMMLRKLFFSMLALCLIAATAPVMVAANERPIQLIVNNEGKGELDALIQKGVMYVALRPYLNALGYTVQYNAADKEVSSDIDGTDLVYWFGEELIGFNDQMYVLDAAAPIIKGHIYLPIRLLSEFTTHTVEYDKHQRSIRMLKYGHGQEPAIRALITKYYETNSPKLLTDDNYQLHYYNLDFDYEADAYKSISEIPVRHFNVVIDDIEYTSNTEATLKVTIILNNQVLDRKNEYVFDIRNENGQWKISRIDWVSLHFILPNDIDETAAAILENHNQDQAAVLQDLRTYYKAYNEENLELALRYTSPSFMERWQALLIDHSTWKQSLEAHFAYADEREMLSEERVVFLGEREAVVQGTLEWSQSVGGNPEGSDFFEVLIYMEYANGHWNFKESLDIDNDFDESYTSTESAAIEL